MRRELATRLIAQDYELWHASKFTWLRHIEVMATTRRSRRRPATCSRSSGVRRGAVRSAGPVREEELEDIREFLRNYWSAVRRCGSLARISRDQLLRQERLAKPIRNWHGRRKDDCADAIAGSPGRQSCRRW